MAKADPRTVVPAEIADYIATMAGELAALAHRNGFDTLVHLLEMARLEAKTLAGPSDRQR